MPPSAFHQRERIWLQVENELEIQSVPSHIKIRRASQDFFSNDRRMGSQQPNSTNVRERSEAANAQTHVRMSESIDIAELDLSTILISSLVDLDY